jgi:hypothetical protein
MPIDTKNGAIEITLIDFVLKIDAGEIVMINVGSVAYSYKYESLTNNYKFFKKKGTDRK